MRKLNYKNWAAFLVGVVLTSAAISAVSAHGQTAASSASSATNQSYTLLEPLPDLNGDGGTMTTITLSTFISYAYKFLIALAVVLAVFMLTVGGFEYMLSEALDTKSDAVKRIQNAIFGLLLALCTYLILYTIDPNLVSPNNLSLPQIPYQSSDTQENAATDAALLQEQTDQQVFAAENQASQYNNEASTSYSQAEQIYNQNDCAQYDETGDYDFDSDAPAACLQSAQLADQGDNYAVQAITTEQKALDQQASSSVFQAINAAPGVIPCSGGPTSGANECYNGFQLNPEAQSQISTQISTIQSGNLAQQAGEISNGSQQAITSQSQNTISAIQSQIQNAITKGAAIYKVTDYSQLPP